MVTLEEGNRWASCGACRVAALRAKVCHRGDQWLARAIFHNEKESHLDKNLADLRRLRPVHRVCNGAPAYFGPPL